MFMDVVDAIVVGDAFAGVVVVDIVDGIVIV